MWSEGDFSEVDTDVCGALWRRKNPQPHLIEDNRRTGTLGCYGSRGSSLSWGDDLALCFQTGSWRKPACWQRSPGLEFPFLACLLHVYAGTSWSLIKMPGLCRIQKWVLEAHCGCGLGPVSLSLSFCPNCSREHCQRYLLWIEALLAPLSKTGEEKHARSGWQRSWILAPGHTVQSRCLFHCNNQTARAEHLVLPGRACLGSWRATSLPGGRASITLASHSRVNEDPLSSECPGKISYS